ncbi:hypothetical protein KYY02_19455 [Streptomyces pimonensis]|uniref:Uncharacterized protein n=1 Tax=Streptomyces pimonensis TaxID=2860288 RepID=A0ABV4J1H7_9ACTN
MSQVVGIRDGHRYTITVTGRGGIATVDRIHRADCPCHTRPARPALSARVARRRKPGRTV